jgi:hypothetical protein
MNGFFGITKAMKMEMRFGIWNVSSLYRSGLAARELAT